MNAHRKNTNFPVCRRGFWGLIGSLILAFGCNMLQARVLPKLMVIGVLQRDAGPKYQARAEEAAEHWAHNPAQDQKVSYPQAAVQVLPGETLTKNTKLDGDVGSKLNPCPNDGIIIGKDNIVIDLNGHTIWGAPTTSDVGINNPGFDDVKIKNGVIKGFSRGVLLQGSEENEVEKLRIETSGWGIVLEGGARHNEIKDNEIFGVAVGGASPLDGIEIFGDRNKIKDNSIVSWINGIVITEGSNNEIEGNLVSRGDNIGILVITDGNKIKDNSIDGWKKYGISVSGDKNRIKGNGLHVNGVFGELETAGILIEGNDNVIENNQADGIDGDGNENFGIKIANGSKGSVVRLNITANNVNHGIFVEAGSEKTLIARNTATHSGSAGDGIHIDALKTTVKNNIACNNGGFGIFAIPGVKDDGGNKAKDNGNHDQCSIGVVKCSAATNCQSSLAKLDSDTDQESQASPEQFTLVQNHPNPFNPQTTIAYDLSEAAQVRLVIYNMLGQVVRTLVDEAQPAGQQRVLWDGRNERGQQVGTGVYLYKLQVGQHQLLRRMVFQK